MINLNQKTYSQPIAFILTLLLVFSMFAPMAYVYGADETDVPATENQQEQPQIEGNAPVESTDPALPGEGTGGSNTPGALSDDEEEIVESELPAGEAPADGEDAVVPETPTEPALLAAPLMVGPQATAADRSPWLGSLLTLTIKQDGKTISPGGQIAPDQSFEVTGKFLDIPLNGDLEGQFLNPGDWAIFPLDAKLSLTGGSPTSHTLTYDGKTIGTATFEEIESGNPSKGLQVRVVFVDDESLWESYTDIKNLSFNVSLKYDGSGIGEGDPAKDIVILGKTYKIYKEIVPIEPSIQKKGEFNQATGNHLDRYCGCHQGWNTGAILKGYGLYR